MDLPIILAVVSGLIIIILFALLFRQRKSDDADNEAETGTATGGRRTVGARNRARQRAAQVIDEDEDGVELEKMGAKKRAKLEAKAEKKAQREVEEREREERKKKKELAEEERKKLEELEKEEELRKEEEERKAKEEKERQEHEEYLKMKAAFSIEEEGYEENDEDQESQLKDFLGYIKTNKVVLMEDLASHFRLKTQAVISRIQDLQADGTLTGVIDDRGKFIYISESELEAVAKFVKQRGRVSITELAENSQKLINLNPNISIGA